jgi:hypothetical protein
MGIDGNETADQSDRNTSSHPLVGPQPAFSIDRARQGSNQGMDMHKTRPLQITSGQWQNRWRIIQYEIELAKSIDGADRQLCMW